MGDESATKAVLEHHLKAFGEGLDSIMEDYTDESVVITPDGTYRGLMEIRGFFMAFVAGLPEDIWDSFEIKRQEIVGDYAYMHWEAKPWVLLGTDTFVVKDGKFVLQTFAAYSAE